MTSVPELPASWPTVPALYGWLSLDRRGNWRLRDEVVRHAGLIAYLNANYGVDEAGNWRVQNGPQRVYVSLAYTPWVWRLDADGGLVAHTGEGGGAPQAAFLDEDGAVLLQSARGIGVLDDRDLAQFVDACHGPGQAPPTEDELLAVSAGGAGVSWRGLPLQPILRATVPDRFGFVARPVAA